MFCPQTSWIPILTQLNLSRVKTSKCINTSHISVNIYGSCVLRVLILLIYNRHKNENQNSDKLITWNVLQTPRIVKTQTTKAKLKINARLVIKS